MSKRAGTDRSHTLRVAQDKEERKAAQYDEWNYYHRTDDGKPTVSVCLIRNNATGSFSRGVAICSDKDAVIKSKGRKIARNRAYAADKEGTYIDQLTINRGEAKLWLSKVGLTPEDLYNSKGVYEVKLSPFEVRLVYGVTKSVFSESNSSLRLVENDK